MEQSNYNMVISIITAVLIVPIMVLSLIFQNNTLTRVLLSIYGGLGITYYILKSIMYHKDESTSKIVLDRLSNSIFDVVSLLVIINFCLLLPNSFKWILFGLLIFECPSITQSPLSFKTGLFKICSIAPISSSAVLSTNSVSASKVITLIFILLYLYPISVVLGLGIVSIIGFYINHLLGRLLQNKLILSFDLTSIIIFGIFLILI